MAAPVYTVKGIKTFIGMEGEGFNATLCRDGKPVAFVIDDASGGMMDFQWRDFDKGRVEAEVLSWDDKPMTVKMTVEERILSDFVATLPVRVCDFNDTDGKPAELRVTMDLFVDELIGDASLLKQINRWVKNGAAMVNGKDILTFKCDPSEKNFATLRAKYPNGVILNSLSDADKVAAVKKAK